MIYVAEREMLLSLFCYFMREISYPCAWKVVLACHSDGERVPASTVIGVSVSCSDNLSLEKGARLRIGNHW